MNNHAKQMTEEIDRATDLERLEREQWLSERGNGQPVPGEQFGAEQGISGQIQRQVGGAALRVGREQYSIENGMTAGLEAEKPMSHNSEATVELAQVEQEIERPDEFVGEESKLQERERLQEDLEDLKNDDGVGQSFEEKIVARSQEKVAEEAVPEIERIIKQKSFAPFELEGKRNWYMNQLLLRAFNRRFGDRNGAA